RRSAKSPAANGIRCPRRPLIGTHNQFRCVEDGGHARGESAPPSRRRQRRGAGTLVHNPEQFHVDFAPFAVETEATNEDCVSTQTVAKILTWANPVVQQDADG